MTRIISRTWILRFFCQVLYVNKCHIKHVYPIGRVLAIGVFVGIVHENYPHSNSPRYFLSSVGRESSPFNRGWVRPCCQVRRPSGIYRNKPWFVNFSSGSGSRQRTMQHWSTCGLLERGESLYLFLVKRVTVSIFVLSFLILGDLDYIYEHELYSYPGHLLPPILFNRFSID